MASSPEDVRRLYNDESSADRKLIFSSLANMQVHVHEEILRRYNPLHVKVFDWKTSGDVEFGIHADVVLLLTEQAYGFPLPAAHERQWLFWFNLATIGLNSTYCRNPVPLTLKVQARYNLQSLALGQSDIDVVHQIITKINDRNDPFLTSMIGKPQNGETAVRRKRRRSDVSPGNARGRAKHRSAIATPDGSGSRTVSAQHSPAPRTASTLEERQRDPLPTSPTVSDSAGLGETSPVSIGAANDSPQVSLAVLPKPTKEHSRLTRLSLRRQQSEFLNNGSNLEDSAVSTPRTSEEEDPLAEDEYFIKEIKSHQYWNLVKWRGRSEQQAEWVREGSVLRKGKLRVDKVLKSELELEVQYEESPEGETTWEPERQLRCPDLVGPNLLEQYKEEHKLGVYDDED